MLWTVTATTLREMPRRRAALGFAFLLPLVFYASRINVQWQAIRFMAIGVGWAMATPLAFLQRKLASPRPTPERTRSLADGAAGRQADGDDGDRPRRGGRVFRPASSHSGSDPALLRGPSLGDDGADIGSSGRTGQYGHLPRVGGGSGAPVDHGSPASRGSVRRMGQSPSPVVDAGADLCGDRSRRSGRRDGRNPPFHCDDGNLPPSRLDGECRPAPTGSHSPSLAGSASFGQCGVTGAGRAPVTLGSAAAGLRTRNTSGSRRRARCGGRRLRSPRL